MTALTMVSQLTCAQLCNLDSMMIVEHKLIIVFGISINLSYRVLLSSNSGIVTLDWVHIGYTACAYGKRRAAAHPFMPDKPDDTGACKRNTQHVLLVTQELLHS